MGVLLTQGHLEVVILKMPDCCAVAKSCVNFGLGFVWFGLGLFFGFFSFVCNEHGVGQTSLLSFCK